MILGFDDLELRVCSGLNAPRHLAQPAQLAEPLHPAGLAWAGLVRAGGELLLQRLIDELLERLAALGAVNPRSAPLCAARATADRAT